MRLLSNAFAWATVLPVALSLASPLHAALPWGVTAGRSMPCNRDPYVDTTVQVCAKKRDGAMHYRMAMP